MSTATKPQKAKKAKTTKKVAKAKKPSMENTGTGNNNPTATEQKEDSDINQYMNVDSGKDTGDDSIQQTIDESDNVGKNIEYK